MNSGTLTSNDYGGNTSGDLYGATENERATSTEYKMVYEKDYTTAQKYKGDAVYETSNSDSSLTNSWFSEESKFPGGTSLIFFCRSGHYSTTHPGSFCFSLGNGNGFEQRFLSCSTCTLR